MLSSYLEDLGYSKNFQIMLVALLVSTCFVFILYFFFDPIWLTNDDIGMSMIAHGYGLAAFGSPKLIYSNVLWGYLVRLIPEVNGMLGYSYATLGTLVVVGASLIYCTYKLKLGYEIPLAIFLLLMLRPVLFPQFTLNAGLLMVAAIVCWNLFEKKQDNLSLAIGCIFAFASYLIRNQEFLLVLLIASPLIPWRTLFLDRTAKLLLLILIAAIAVATIIDHKAYQGAEWKTFRELNLVRVPYTDFKAGKSLLQHPEIFSRFAYSQNDISLISTWFFLDPKISNPSSLKAMATEIGAFHAKENIFTNEWIAIKAIWKFNAYLLIAALLLALLRPSLRVFLCWGLCIGVMLIVSMLGRPSAVHIFMPVISILLISPLLENITGWRRHRIITILIAAALINTITVISELGIKQANAELIQKTYRYFPTSPIVIWGNAFPYEALYPVKGTSNKIMSYKLYGLGVFTLAPFSRAYYEQQQGNGMIDRIIRGESVDLLTSEHSYQLFQKYCNEHLAIELTKLSEKKFIVPDKDKLVTTLLIKSQANSASRSSIESK